MIPARHKYKYRTNKYKRPSCAPDVEYPKITTTHKINLLQCQSVQDELLESFHSLLKVRHCQRLIVTVSHENGARPVQIPRVVALEKVNICAIVGHDGVKAYWEYVSTSTPCLP